MTRCINMLINISHLQWRCWSNDFHHLKYMFQFTHPLFMYKYWDFRQNRSRYILYVQENRLEAVQVETFHSHFEGNQYIYSIPSNTLAGKMFPLWMLHLRALGKMSALNEIYKGTFVSEAVFLRLHFFVLDTKERTSRYFLWHDSAYQTESSPPRLV